MAGAIRFGFVEHKPPDFWRGEQQGFDESAVSVSLMINGHDVRSTAQRAQHQA
jgi:hypothetical protein